MSGEKKVLFVAFSERYSGAEMSLVELAEGIGRRSSWEVHLAHGKNASRLNAAFSAHPTFPLPALPLHKSRNPFHWLRLLINWIQVVFQLRKLMRSQDIDLIHANSWKDGLYAGPAARLAGLPCFCHLRDHQPHRLVNWLLRKTCRHFICVSHFIRQHAPLPPARSAVIYNGMSSPATASPPLHFPHIPPSATVIAQVGQIVPWKGFADGIEVAAMLCAGNPELHFLLVGGDWEGMQSELVRSLKERVQALGLEERIHFCGQVEDMEGLWRQVDVLVHCARKEPFGRVVAEAMLRRVPVVAVASGGPAEVLEEGANGLLYKEGDQEGMANGVALLLSDAALRESLVENAAAWAAKELNPDAQIAKLEALFNKTSN